MLDQHRQLLSLASLLRCLNHPWWDLEGPHPRWHLEEEHESDVFRPKGAEMTERIDLNWGLAANPSREVHALAARYEGIQADLPPESDILLLMSHFFRYRSHPLSCFLCTLATFRVISFLRLACSYEGVRASFHLPTCVDASAIHERRCESDDARRHAVLRFCCCAFLLVGRRG